MITLRGKLTRTLVERKPPEPKITRSTSVTAPPGAGAVAPAGLSVTANNTTALPPVAAGAASTVDATVTAAAATDDDTAAAVAAGDLPTTGVADADGIPQTMAANNGAEGAPSAAITATTLATAATTTTTLSAAEATATAQAVDSPSLVEEWTWKGVWAFGDLPDEEEEKKEGEMMTMMADKDTTMDETRTGEKADPQKPSSAVATGDTDVVAANQKSEKLGGDGSPPPADKPAPKKPGRKKKSEKNDTANNAAKPRPFTYRWLKAVDADSVIVPSSLTIMTREVDEEERKSAESGGEKVAAEGCAPGVDATKSSTSTSFVVEGGTPARSAGGDILASAESAAKEVEKRSEQQQPKESTEMIVEGAAAGDAVMAEALEAIIDWGDDSGDTEMKYDAGGESNPSAEAGGENKTDALRQPTAVDAALNQPTTMTTIEALPTASNFTPIKVQVPNSNAPTEPAPSPPPTPKEHKMITYGETPFTDASSADPNATCPNSGKWEGHFENVVANPGRPAGRPSASQKKRKRQKDNRIREMFYLFFNATPPNGAREVFVDSDSTIAANNLLDDRSSTSVDDTKKEDDAGGVVAAVESKDEAEGDGEPELPLLPKGRIHVRGYGTNRFGTFEIVGSLNPNTGTLQCQRMYVPVPTAAEISKATGQNNRRTNSGRFLSGLDLTIPGEDEEKTRRSVGRKRKSTWKKRDMDSSFEAYEVGVDGNPILAPGGVAAAGVPGGAGSGTIDIASIVKKRSRLSFESTVSIKTPASAGPGILKPPPQCREASTDSLGILHPPSAAAGTMSIFASGATKPPPSALKRSPSSLGGGSGKKSKKKKSAKISGGAGAPTATSAAASRPMPIVTVPPPVSIIPTLPKAGDPFLARWKAAHYLYYQRVEQEPEGDGHQASWANNAAGKTDGTGSDKETAVPNPALVKINYVIYEGEMHDGVREGRGICLYNNNTLYEGQWKRNKEHGHGKLMTADRKRVIYEGTWEKGKMHGQGAYYYYVGSGKNVKENGRYIGSFRQNLRNGQGLYTLPDGSLYDGEFRDNIQNGYGIFRWPDNSIYEGAWKDGKRHGSQGILVGSDGFKYEGAWVNNSMEGRGVATYPKGQVYDGTWVNGKREGRGTIRFTNGAVYEGRFKDDYMEGQGTMKMNRNVIIPKITADEDKEGDNTKEAASPAEGKEATKHDWMIPLQFQSDIGHIHQKAGFTQIGL